MPGGWPSQEFQTDALPLTVVTADPLPVPNVGWLYSKLVGPVTEFFLRRNDGSIAQLTSGAGILVHTHQSGPEGGQLDHGLAMIPASLLDDDHPQYALTDKTRPAVWVSAADLTPRSVGDLGTKDHDLLTGLLDDDHTQYALANKTRPAVWVSAADLSIRSIADLGTKTHSLLTGLAADDHLQYALADKSRPAVWVSAADLTPRSIADLGTKTHSLLTGLGADDHLQYALADKSRPAVWVAAGDLTPRSIADLGTKTHSLLTGLGSDDHTQYALADKSRPTPWVSAADLSVRSIADLGTKTHSLLTGLAADDHPQYQLKSVLTTKGDLYVATGAATIVRLPIGTDGQVLTADSAQATGMKWATGGGGGITGAGVAGRMTFWDGVSSVTSDAGFTYDSVNDRLTVPIINVGANPTPSTGDVWFETPFLKYRTAGGTRTAVNADDTQTITGEKTFSTNRPIFSADPGMQVQTQIEFSNYGNPTAAGRLSRSSPFLKYHDGAAVRTILTDGVDVTTVNTWTFNGAGASIIIGDELQFTSAGANATAGGRLRRNGAFLTWFDSGVGAGQLLCTVSAHTITGAYTFNTAMVFADGVKITFNPNATNAGINVGAQAGDPSTLANGDVWYNSTTNRLRVRQNGASVDMIPTAGGGILSWGSATDTTAGSLARWGIGTETILANDSQRARIIVTRSGTLKNLFARVSASGGANNQIYTVRVNGANTAITCTITGGGGASDTSNSVSVSAGDLVEIDYSTSGVIGANESIASLELA